MKEMKAAAATAPRYLRACVGRLAAPKRRNSCEREWCRRNEKPCILSTRGLDPAASAWLIHKGCEQCAYVQRRSAATVVSSRRVIIAIKKGRNKKAPVEKRVGDRGTHI